MKDPGASEDNNSEWTLYAYNDAEMGNEAAENTRKK